ncbi:MAG: histidine phosphotransferase family protein [Janthinobacterium lividum]
MIEDLKFAQMLCSRLCHDLITPISAINSGFEILQECEADDQKMLMDLTKSSAETAARRLTFYRAAYGYSGIDTSSKFIFVKKLMEDFLISLKINLKWSDNEKCNQNLELLHNLNLWSKILLNSVLLASEALPYGGEICIKFDVVNDRFKFCFGVKGKIIGFRPELLNALQNKLDVQDYTPQVIHGILLLKLYQKLNVKFQMNAIQDQEFSFEII